MDQGHEQWQEKKRVDGDMHCSVSSSMCISAAPSMLSCSSWKSSDMCPRLFHLQDCRCDSSSYNQMRSHNSWILLLELPGLISFHCIWIIPDTHYYIFTLWHLYFQHPLLTLAPMVTCVYSMYIVYLDVTVRYTLFFIHVFPWILFSFFKKFFI